MGTTSDGRPFYVMKRVEGRTLRDLLDERGGHATDLMWRERLLAIFGEICDVVAFAHAHGIVHRDLKPDNILVDAQDSVTIVDWGLAKRTSGDETTRTIAGDVLGSPGYMAPEQAAGNAVDAGPPADVFALGVVLYEILTGKLPFVGATPREVMLSAIYRSPQDPRKAVPWLWLSRSLVAVCRKALEHEPAARFPNARAFADEIRALRLGRPCCTARAGALERFRWAVKRRPVFSALVASALGALAVGALVVVGQVHADERLASKAYAQVTQNDRRVDALGRSARELAQQLRTADPQARRALELNLAELRRRQLLVRIDSMYMLRDVDQVRFIRRDPRVVGMMTSRALDALSSALELDEPALAKALANLLAQSAQDYSLSEADAERLRALTAEADRAFDEAIKHPDPPPPTEDH